MNIRRLINAQITSLICSFDSIIFSAKIILGKGLFFFYSLAGRIHPVRLRQTFRLIWALIFATFAAIFSQLIPPIFGEQSFIIRTLLTLAAAGIGYVVFPNAARWVRVITMTTFNFVVHRVSAEVSSQLAKFTRSNASFPHSTGQVGAVSLTRPLILDTSAVIDGRVLDVTKTGFINGLVLIPQFVLIELQQVADSSDDLKRQRGRRGFEVVEELKKNKIIRLEIWDKDSGGKTVDEKLINLAKALHGKILTTDFNLNRLATLSNIPILNINDLANAVKTVALPGESLQIKIVHLGKDKSQGVGYLADGAMVVVADCAEKIGQTIKTEVTKNIQNPAGRMIFAKKEV